MILAPRNHLAERLFDRIEFTWRPLTWSKLYRRLFLCTMPISFPLWFIYWLCSGFTLLMMLAGEVAAKSMVALVYGLWTGKELSRDG